MKSKVLMTGMTAQHYSLGAAQKTLTYSTMLSRALAEIRRDVVYAEPDVDWTAKDLDEYCKIFVGLTSPLSVAANGTYGALSLLSVLAEDPRLVVYVDGPEPGRTLAGLRSVARTPAALVKPFYAKRRGYRAVAGDKRTSKRVLGAVTKFVSGPWPTTICPTLPWSDLKSDITTVSEQMSRALLPLSLDSMYLSGPTIDAVTTARREVWGVDNHKTRWAKTAMATLALPYEPIKQSKFMPESDVEDRISKFAGVMLTVQDDKRLWWSPRFVQSLNAGTPVVTDWRKSGKIGPAWAVLAGAVECMGQIDRYELSVSQWREYRDKMQPREEALTALRKIVEAK